MMAGRRRRATVAYTPAERDAWLRVAYLEHYGDDPDFAGELLALYDERAVPAGPLPLHPVEWWIAAADGRPEVRAFWHLTDEAAAYVSAVRELAGRYGLPRLQEPAEWSWTPLTVGEWLVHAWCHLRAAQGRQVGPEWFPSGYGAAEALPDVPARAFDPRRERYGDARKRLSWRKRADLEATAEAAEAGGYVYMDNAPELRRDLGWLYRHVARGESLASIAASDVPPSPDGADRAAAVRKAVRVLLPRIL